MTWAYESSCVESRDFESSQPSKKGDLISERRDEAVVLQSIFVIRVLDEVTSTPAHRAHLNGSCQQPPVKIRSVRVFRVSIAFFGYFLNQAPVFPANAAASVVIFFIFSYEIIGL